MSTNRIAVRGMVATAAAAACLLLATVPAWAHAATPDARVSATRTAVVVVHGVPGSEALLAGDYAKGLAQSLAAYQRTPGLNVAPLAVNLCAAHVMLGQQARAEAECARAVAAAGRPRVAGLTRDQYRAVALVNRGVLHQLHGDVAAAGQDFDAAARLFPGLGVARSNLGRLAGKASRDR